jgi:hypothetical protein
MVWWLGIASLAAVLGASDPMGPPKPAAPCPGDLNGDRVVDDADFVLFNAAYGLLDCFNPAMPAGCPADLNHDTIVDDADLVLFSQAYDRMECP